VFLGTFIVATQRILRQPNLIALNRPPNVAHHAAREVLAAVVDLDDRLFAFTTGIGQY
jgi:hypothetical protein